METSIGIIRLTKPQLMQTFIILFMLELLIYIYLKRCILAILRFGVLETLYQTGQTQNGLS